MKSWSVQLYFLKHCAGPDLGRWLFLDQIQEVRLWGFFSVFSVINLSKLLNCKTKGAPSNVMLLVYTSFSYLH